MCGNAAACGFSRVQEKRLAKQEKHGKQWQRKAACRVKGSKRCQAYVKASKHRQYGVNLRDELAHQASHAMASDSNYLLFVLAALPVKNMTASANGTVGAPGENVR